MQQDLAWAACPLQAFFSCFTPSHLCCPPYSVNYDLTSTGLQTRSSSWPVIVWNLRTSNTCRAHPSAVYAFLSLFMRETWETSLFPSPEVKGSNGCYQSCLAPCFIRQLLQQPANTSACKWLKYLSCWFKLSQSELIGHAMMMTITSVCYFHWCK